MALDDEAIETPFVIDIKQRVIKGREGLIEDLPAFVKFLNLKVPGGHIKIPSMLNCCMGKAKKQEDPLRLPIMPAMNLILEQQWGLSETYVFPQLQNDKPVANNSIYFMLKKMDFRFQLMHASSW